MRKIFISAVLMLFVATCGNAFTRNYHGMSLAEIQSSSDLLTCEEPVFFDVGDRNASFREELESMGYVYLGGISVEMTGKNYSPELEIAHAKTLGACVIISYKRYIGHRAYAGTPRYATHGGTSTRVMGETVRESTVPNSYYVESNDPIVSKDATWDHWNALFVKKRGVTYGTLKLEDLKGK